MTMLTNALLSRKICGGGGGGCDWRLKSSIMYERLRGLTILLFVLFSAPALELVQAQQVVGLQLVRSPTGTVIANLNSNNTIIYMNATSTASLSVVAIVVPATTKSIVFGYNANATYNVDRVIPYTMCLGTELFPACSVLNNTSVIHTVTARVRQSTAQRYRVAFSIQSGWAPTPSPAIGVPTTKAPALTLAPTLAPAPVVGPITKAPVSATPTKAPVKATLAPVVVTTTKAPTSSITKAPTTTTKAPQSPAPVTKSPTVIVVPTVGPPNNFVPILINCGSNVTYNDTLGRTWSADTYFTGGYLYDTNTAIAGTLDDPIYNCERFGQSTYTIPVPSGTYDIILHFAEIFHTTQNQRVFDVIVEGGTATINDLDLVAAGGGSFKAVTRLVPSIVVNDGFLSIQFKDNIPLIDFPKISGIEIQVAVPRPPTLPPVPAPTSPPGSSILINCGAVVPHTDALGRVWSADRYFTGGLPYDTNIAISGTIEDPLYNCERYGASIVYSIPVINGVYDVILHFAEIYHTQAGLRVFDVVVEGAPALVDVDLVQLGGGVAFKALTQTVTQPVAVTDGFLTIQFLSNVPQIDYAKISAIEVNVHNGTTTTPSPMTSPTSTKAPTTKNPTLAAPTKAPTTKTPTLATPTKAPVVAPPTPTSAPVVLPPSVAFQPVLINCGGGLYVDQTRRLWIADTYVTGGNVYLTNKEIGGTTDDDLFNSMRWGQSTYNIPVPEGLYEVVLHMAETYWGFEGERVFDVNVEAKSLSDIDVVKLTGGLSDTATTKVTSAIVADGLLTIQFLDNSPRIDAPLISAIEVNRLGEIPPTAAPVPAQPTKAPVTPPFQTVLMNCAGPAYVDTEGRQWSADRYFRQGNTNSNSANNILDTQDDILYFSERWGEFSYEIPVPLGNYEVILHFAEVYFQEAGQRVFDVIFEGEDRFEDVDIYVEAGQAAYTALKKTSPIIPVMDGFLTIQFKDNVPKADNPSIAAIEVIRSGDHYSHAVSGGPYAGVDVDGDGAALVPVDASLSHTHGPDQTLSVFKWRNGTEVLATGKITNLLLPVGDHEITLTVVDTSGSISNDVTTITVKQKGFPEVFALSPVSGPVAGGTTVTISGQDIGNATSVRFGKVIIPQQDITVIDSANISVVTRQAAVGVPVQVSVITPIGESKTVTYTYISSVPIEFNVTELVTLEDIVKPTAVSFGPDGKLYVGTEDGVLWRIKLNDSYDAVVQMNSKQIDPVTKRAILGIAFDPIETASLGPNLSVYISTSQIYHGQWKNSFGTAINGKIQVVRGANLELISNVVTGLPISEIDHAVNGIYFGDHGELYIPVGGNTNGGVSGGKISGSGKNRENYFSAAVLVANLGVANFSGFITYNADIDGDPITGYGPSGVEVFAAGTRNPYGVFLHSNGKLYGTDNGPNIGYGDFATGCGPGQNISGYTQSDKLLLLKRGGYYGHPNHKRAQTDPRQCVWYSNLLSSQNGYTAPLMRVKSSTDGIIEFESDHFNGQMRGDLILSQHNAGLYRVVLSPDGESVNPFTDPAIGLAGTGGLVVTQAPDGTLIDGRNSAGKCFLYKPVEPPSSVMEIKTVFPRRGGLAGGSKLMVFGVNFSGGSPSVTVGGNPCTDVVLVSSTKIECTLPGGTLGGKDVIVTIGADSDTYAKGYRYIKGVPP